MEESVNSVTVMLISPLEKPAWMIYMVYIPIRPSIIAQYENMNNLNFLYCVLIETPTQIPNNQDDFIYQVILQEYHQKTKKSIPKERNVTTFDLYIIDNGDVISYNESGWWYYQNTTKMHS